MQFSIYKPAPDLREAVQCYWVLRGSKEPGAEAIFPDGSIELAFHVGDPLVEIGAAGAVRQPHRILVGQMLRPTLITATGRVDTFGIRFTPAGARRMLGFPLAEVENQIVSLDDAWGEPSRQIESCLAQAASDQERVAVADRLLRVSLDRSGRACPMVNFVLGEISRGTYRNSGEIRTRDLARAWGVSTRQLQRVFRDQVGTSPKMFIRIRRFQSALRLAGETGAGVAAACGYFDQSHLIRDFQEFGGLTPAQFRARRVALLQDLEAAPGVC